MTEIEIKQDIAELEILKKSYSTLADNEGNVHAKNSYYKIHRSIKHAIEALREYAEQRNPKPLTEDQIRGMVGRWVWLEKKKDHFWSGWDKLIGFCDGGNQIRLRHDCLYPISEFKKIYDVYAHEPKQEARP